MKRLVLTLVCVLTAMLAQGQDIMTIWDTNVYMFNPMPSSLTLQSSNSSSSAAQLEAGLLMQAYYSPDTVTVYGVALTMRNRIEAIDLCPYGCPGTCYYVALMSPNPGVYASGANPYNYTALSHVDTAYLHKENIKECLFSYNVTSPEVGTHVTKCVEIYFNTPMQINRMVDTFYVGRMHCGGDGGLYFSPLDTYAQWWDSAPPSPFLYGWGNLNEFTEYSYSHSYRSIWGYVFPIIGFHCKGFDEKIDSVQLTAVGDFGARVTWNAVEENATYLVRLMSDAGMDSVVETTDTTIVFNNLPYSTTFDVQIRQACHYATVNYDTMVYSPWTTALSFSTADSAGFGDSTGTEGITTAEGVDFGLTPNPARGEVEVVLLSPVDEEVCTLSAVSLDGRERMAVAVPRGTDRLRLDVGGLPSGVYLLKLVSPRGVSVRRLLVL